MTSYETLNNGTKNAKLMKISTFAHILLLLACRCFQRLQITGFWAVRNFI